MCVRYWNDASVCWFAMVPTVNLLPLSGFMCAKKKKKTKKKWRSRNTNQEEGGDNNNNNDNISFFLFFFKCVTCCCSVCVHVIQQLHVIHIVRIAVLMQEGSRAIFQARNVTCCIHHSVWCSKIFIAFRMLVSYHDDALICWFVVVPNLNVCYAS